MKLITSSSTWWDSNYKTFFLKSSFSLMRAVLISLAFHCTVFLCVGFSTFIIVNYVNLIKIYNSFDFIDKSTLEHNPTKIYYLLFNYSILFYFYLILFRHQNQYQSNIYQIYKSEPFSEWIIVDWSLLESAWLFKFHTLSWWAFNVGYSVANFSWNREYPWRNSAMTKSTYVSFEANHYFSPKRPLSLVNEPLNALWAYSLNSS